MAIEDIKKTILAEAKRQIEQIEKEDQLKIQGAQSEWQKKVTAKKTEIIALAQRKAEQKIQQASFQFKIQSQTEVLKKKQKILDKVYQKVEEKLKELDETAYIELMKKLIEQLPDTEGKLVSSPEKQDLLKKALRKTNKKYGVAAETITGAGGFIFHSKEIDIDNTFAALVSQAKEQTLLDVTKILFKEYVAF